jgi:hypothetical protein
VYEPLATVATGLVSSPPGEVPRRIAKLVAPDVGVQVSVTWPSPAVAARSAGASGAGGSGVVFASVDAGLSPPAFDAITL